MKIILVISILLLLSKSNVFSQEQKVTVKKELVSVNDSAVFKLVSIKYSDAYILYNLNNEKLAVFNAQFYSDSKQITPGNPRGRVGYFDITFFDENMDKCEIRIVGGKKKLAQLIISEGFIKDGKLDETIVKQFCLINGTKFSEDRKNSGTTIIINH